MPVVPFTPVAAGGRQQNPLPTPDDPWVLMAAAQMDAEGRLVKAEGTFMGELKEGSPEHKAWMEGPANASVRKPKDPVEFMKGRSDEEGAYLPGSDQLWLRKKQPKRDDRDLVS